MQTVETPRTERLTAERLRPSDLGDLRGLHREPKIMATLSADGDVAPEKHTLRSLRRGLDHWERHGYGTWMFRDRARERFAGYFSLWNARVGGDDEVELAYSVASEYWGRGLATEIAAAAAAVGFERLGLEKVVAITLPTNRASRRVMEKTGFRYERDIVHGDLPHVLYRLPASRWRDAAKRNENRREEKQWTQPETAGGGSLPKEDRPTGTSRRRTRRCSRTASSG